MEGIQLTYPGLLLLGLAIIGYFLKQKDKTIDAKFANIPTLDTTNGINDKIKEINDKHRETRDKIVLHEHDCILRNEKAARLEETVKQLTERLDKSQSGVDIKFETINQSLLDIAARLPSVTFESNFNDRFKEFEVNVKEELKLQRRRSHDIANFLTQLGLKGIRLEEHHDV